MSSNADEKPIDFEILKEPWNKYEISDNSVLKTRFVLKKVLVKNLSENKKSFGFDGEHMNVIFCAPEWKGTPDAKIYSPAELRESIDKEDMRYNTLSEEWNEYLLDDGTRIRLKTTVTGVVRTNKFDKIGDRVYLVDTNAIMNIKQPKPLK